MIGLPLTLVVAAVGMLFALLWLLLSPVRTLRVLPATAQGCLNSSNISRSSSSSEPSR
jgi:hypothetical protein